MGRLPSEVPWTVRDLAHVVALESIHPFPETRNEYMLAQLMAMISNMFGGKKTTVDFMLSAQMGREAQKSATFEDQFRRAFALSGTKVIKTDGTR